MTGSFRLGQKFKTIKDVLEAIKNYSKEQAVPYTIFNCTKADTYNKGVAPEKRMPEDQGYKDMVIACKHYGKPRQSKHKPGTIKRVNQSTFKRLCGAKLNLCFNIIENCHIVTKLEEVHTNHVSDPKFAKHYPEFRKPTEETQTKVQVLFENEAKPHRIRDVVLNSGVLATGQDIQNMRNKWRSTFKGKDLSPEEALFDQLEKLKKEDPGSMVVVHFDRDTNVIQSVFFQTSYMREGLQQYPELLIMDTTYKLCENEMPLSVFSVVDCFGIGRIAGYAIIFAETKQIVTSALQVLKLGYEKLANEVKVVYIDKAQSEIASIKEVLPNTETHLCDYHVKDAFSRNSVKKLVKENWEEIESTVRAMIHAPKQETYDNLYIHLNQIAGKDSEFIRYFNKNWHNCGLVWCDYQRNESFTLGERTTGRVESHNAKIKLMIDKKLPVPEVVVRLCVLNRNASIENAQRVFNCTTKTKYHKYSQDPVIQEILKVNTPFVGNFLKAQYERSLEPPSSTDHDTTLETCDCKYFNQSKLICSHIFRMRRLNGVEEYDHKLVPPRWTVIMPSASDQDNFSNFEIITSPIKTSKTKKALSQEERYNLAESIAKRISSFVSNFGGAEFHHRIVALQNFEDLMRMGKRVAVVGVDGEGQLEQGEINDKATPNEDTSSTCSVGEAQGEKGVENLDTEVVDPESENEILVSQQNGQEEYFILTETDKKKLKLPMKCPVPGRPKGKRKQKGKTRCAKNLLDTIEEDADDVATVGDTCPSCNGPLICRTSCSKANQGRKYKVCKTNELPGCSTSHKWLDKDHGEDSRVEETNCIVCETTGPPSASGGHKCVVCGVPVHAIEGAQCCSIATNDEEGYGSKGRVCLKHAAEVVKSSSAVSFFKEIDMPIVPVENVLGLIDKNVEVQLIDNAVHPSQDTPHCDINNSFDDGNEIDTQSSLAVEIIDLTDGDEFVASAPIKEEVGSQDEVQSDLEVTDGTVNPSQQISDYGMSPLSTPVRSQSASMSPPRIDPICFGCKEPAKLFTARTAKNYGRRFYACATQQLPKCKWMNWLDKATPKKGSKDQVQITSFFKGSDTSSALCNANPSTPRSMSLSLLDDGFDAILSNVGEVMDPSPSKEIDTSLVPARLDFTNITIRKRRVIQEDAEQNEDTRPKVKKTKDVILIEKTTSQSSDMGKETPHSKKTTPNSMCNVCNLAGADLTKCFNCKKCVHEDCSVRNPTPATNHLDYVCLNCFCKLCKNILEENHNCLCHICEQPSDMEDDIICYRCEKITHCSLFLNCGKKIRAAEKNNEILFICKNCLHALTVHISVAAKMQITQNEMLSDEHMVRASVMLSAQFCDTIGGLCAPMGVAHGDKVSNREYYPAHDNSERPWVQIMYTGRQHWVTAIFLKRTNVKILDSLRDLPISGHVKIQVAMISSSKERILIGKPPCKQQDNGIDCGLFAIANATEFCFTSSINYVDYDEKQLRHHWLQCIENGKLSPFPRRSKRAKKVKEQEDFEILPTYCKCHLPSNYDDLIECDGPCSEWFHKSCVGVKGEPENWFCEACGH